MRDYLIWRERKKALLAGVASSGLLGAVTLLGAVAISPGAAQAGCSVSGDAQIVECDSDGVFFLPQQGDVSAAVDSMAISSGSVNVIVQQSGQFGNVSLSVSNTNVTSTSGAGAVTLQGVAADLLAVSLGSDVSITNGDGYGGLFVAALQSGNISINSAAAITSTNSSGIYAVTSDGTVAIVNSGALSALDNYGIFVGANNDAVEQKSVSVINSANIQSENAGIAVGQFYGDVYIENSGAITSVVNGAIVASAEYGGNIELQNSGSAVSTDGSGARFSADYGNVDVTNSGLIQGAFAGLSAYISMNSLSGYGDITIENTATGRIIGQDSGGLSLATANGSIAVNNAGLITGGRGLEVGAYGGGAVTIENTGTIIGTVGTGVSINGGMVTLTNSGTISGDGGAIYLDALFDGRLILKDGSTINGTVEAFGDELTLQLDFAKATTFDASLIGNTSQYQGFDVVEATGSGALTFTGTSDFSGLVSLTGGKVVVDGDMRLAEFTVGDGVQLSGTGSLGTLTIENGGSVAPGHSPGTMYVYGDLNFLTGSTYEADLTATGLADNIQVSGNVSIASGTTLAVSDLSLATSLNTTYQLITVTGGGTVTGSFTTLRDPWSFVDLDVTNNGSSLTLGFVRNSVSFADAAVGPNGTAAALAVESLGPSAALYNDLLWTTADDATALFDQLSGSIHSSQIGGHIESDLLFSNLMLSQLDGAGLAGARRSAGESTFWMSGFGRRAERDGDNLGSDLTDTTRGLAFGVNLPVAQDWTLGLAAALGQDHVTEDSGLSRSEADSYFVGVSAAKDFGPVNWKVGGAFTQRNIDTRRNVSLPSADEQLRASYDARSWQAFTEVSTLLPQGDLRWQPFGNLTFVHYDSDGFSESAGDAALAGRGVTEDALYSTLGVRMGWDLPVGLDQKTSLTAHAGWRHGFGADNVDRTVSFLAGGDAFSVAGALAARDSAVVGVGFAVQPTANSSISVAYDGQFGAGTTAHGVKADLKINF